MDKLTIFISSLLSGTAAESTQTQSKKRGFDSFWRRSAWVNSMRPSRSTERNQESLPQSADTSSTVPFRICSASERFIHSICSLRSFVLSVFVPSVIHSFIYSFLHLFVHTFVRPFVHLSIPFFSTFILSFIHSSCVRSFTQFVHSLSHSFVHSFVHSFSHSFVHSFVHSFIRSFVHSFEFSLVSLYAIVGSTVYVALIRHGLVALDKSPIY